MIILSKPLEFKVNIQPACLPNPDYGIVYPLANQTAYTSGWVNKFC
jgi:hypothetical protein